MAQTLFAAQKKERTPNRVSDTYSCPKNQMNHPPLEQLTIEGDKIFHLPHGNLGVKNPHMDIPPISVIAKERVTPARQNENRYSFRLNHHTCPIWRELFSRNILAFQVKFEGEEMSFECIQANLNGRYAVVKQAIEKTNSDYAIERGRLMESIKAHESQKAVEEKRRIEAQDQAQKAFDALEL